jgi:hypothetical protein
MTPTFHEELAVYNANLFDLLAYAGRSVTIRGSEIQGPFESPGQAWRAGRAWFGARPFLVTQIHGDRPHAAPSRRTA